MWSGGGCCEECRRRCGLIHGAVKSFFKVLIGPDFSDLLYIPPMFAPQVSSLVGQKVVLEDSLGNCWRVKLTHHRGSLALRKGWRAFLSDHDLRLGDFLVFHLLGSRFHVTIYDRTACEKTVSRAPSDRHEPPSMGKDLRFGPCSAPRSRLSSNTEVEYEDDVVFPAGRERTKVDVPVSEMLVDDSDSGRGRRVVVGKGLDSSGQAGTTRMPNDGVRMKMETDGLHDDSEEILSVDPLAIAIYDANAFGERKMTKKQGRPRKDSANMSIKSVNSRFGNLPWLSRDEKPVITAPYQIENSAAALTVFGASSSSPVETTLSFKVTVASTSYLELPVNLLPILPKSRGAKKSREGRVVILEDQLRRWWPVLYREEQVRFLSTGWKCFSEANHIGPGDECLLVARDLSKAVFGVSSIHSATSLLAATSSTCFGLRF